jgi:nucleoside-diphosphate kinase
MVDRQSKIVDSSTLSLILVGSQDILCKRDWIVRPSVFVDTLSVRIPNLFIVRPVAFDGAFVDLWVVELSRSHRRSLLGRDGAAAIIGSMSERTLAIIKPDAVERRLTGAIIHRIESSGFQIRAMRQVCLSKRDAEGFYAVHRERPFFGSLTDFMSSGPAVLLVLEAPGAIKKWRALMGATDPAKAEAGTLRKEFAESIERNATHGSDAPETAAYEIGYFFAGMDLI